MNMTKKLLTCNVKHFDDDAFLHTILKKCFYMMNIENSRGVKS